MLLEDVLTRKEGEILEKVLQKKMDANKGPAVIEIKNVKKVYRMGSERICAVDDVSFEINKGEFCCLLGTSGSGKSTLLNLMAGIEKASGGQILIKGKDVRKMSEKQLAKFRQKYLGFVFQSYNLLNSMTALENVEFPLVFKRVPSRRRRKMAKEMLVKVGLSERINHRPKQMSGGQQQRVGNLDTRTTMEVMKLIKQIARDNQQTIVMVTHDPRLADFADKIIHILDGKIQSVELIEHPIDSFEEAVEETAAAEGKENKTDEKSAQDGGVIAGVQETTKTAEPDSTVSGDGDVTIGEQDTQFDGKVTDVGEGDKRAQDARKGKKTKERGQTKAPAQENEK